MGHTLQVNAVANHKERVVTASDDHTVRVFDKVSGRTIRRLEGHTGPVTHIAYSADGKLLVSGSSDTTLKLWDIEKGVCLVTFALHKGPITTLNIEKTFE
mmetsp:Transcript_23863/g.20030  ORF Transcript_23863/g.20030 Transcript_23863/m.20030 type:complete len:100 (-) Transcript_23863:2488-2787(-)